MNSSSSSSSSYSSSSTNIIDQKPWLRKTADMIVNYLRKRIRNYIEELQDSTGLDEFTSRVILEKSGVNLDFPESLRLAAESFLIDGRVEESIYEPDEKVYGVTAYNVSSKTYELYLENMSLWWSDRKRHIHFERQHEIMNALDYGEFYTRSTRKKQQGAVAKNSQMTNKLIKHRYAIHLQQMHDVRDKLDFRIKLLDRGNFLMYSLACKHPYFNVPEFTQDDLLKNGLRTESGRFQVTKEADVKISNDFIFYCLSVWH